LMFRKFLFLIVINVVALFRCGATKSCTRRWAAAYFRRSLLELVFCSSVRNLQTVTFYTQTLPTASNSN